MLSPHEKRRNVLALEHALAQQTLEGLDVPPAAMEDLQRIVQGEITVTDALRNAHARFRHGEVFQSGSLP